ncbi:MAG TPA: ATPase [Myxococcales bacterium]|nr:ATPase [Myxococcales bacterium]
MAYVWISFAAALAIGLPALCTAWAQSRIGPAVAASLAEKPQLSATAVLLLAIPETMVILGFVVALLIVMKPAG